MRTRVESTNLVMRKELVFILKNSKMKPIDIRPNISPFECMMDCMIDAISKT